MPTKKYTDKEGRRHSESYDDKGNLSGHTIEGKDENGNSMYYCESYGENGKLQDTFKQTEVIVGETKKLIDEIRDGKGKLLDYRIWITTKDGKLVNMEPKRGMLARLLDRLRGYNAGDVMFRNYTQDSPREPIVFQMDKIKEDKSLTPEEKRRKLREKLAQYREESGHKSSNKKVGKALKTYLPTREGR